MPTPLRTLIVEDSEADAALLLVELERGGYDVVWRRVCTREALAAALDEPWDLVISDWSMPGFDGLAAFRVVRERGLDVPFLITSGTIEEDVAVEALRAGVHDFLQKGRWARLLPSVRRELREADVRRRQREADAEVARQRERVARSEARYRAMFESSPLPMWTFDPATRRFVHVNDAALRRYGHSRAEFAALTVDALEPPEDAGRDARIRRHRTRDGAVLLVEVEASDFVDDGRTLRLVLAHDVTERERAQEALRRTEEQLRHAQKMEAVGRLAGGVAHEFNNALTVIHGFAALLEEALPSDDPRNDDAVAVRRAAERAAAITRQLLTMSRHSIVSPSSLDLDDVVAGVAPMLRHLVGERVTIDVRRGGLPPIVADPGQLEQVLMNLAVNARDAMPDGGRLTLETRTVDVDAELAGLRGVAPGRWVELAVTDTGVGMDPEVQRRIFDPFFTTKEPGRGTGVGLSIVHGIVAQAGGVVSVYSTVGHGTTFRVWLPVARETVAAPAVARAAAPPTLPPVTVLVVDDEPLVRAVATRILGAAGCQVLEAATAEEARRVCVRHEGALDAVVLDVALTDARGDELARHLRELRPSLRVVLMSGYPAGALTRLGGAPPNLLAKPFTPSTLREAVARAVAHDGAAAAPATPVASGSRPRLLVADDDAGMRRVLVRVLGRAGFEVVEAESGRAAIAALAPGAFEVVLSDVHMPDGGGLDLLRAVRRIDLDVPVILLSGRPDVDSATKAVEHGAFRYLAKPVENDVIVRTVEHASRAHALARLRREAVLVGGAHAGAVDRAGLEVRFDQAMASMWMAFQPIFEARSGALFGVEALLRSGEPSMPSPLDVVDAAVQLGHLSRLGRRTRALAAAALLERRDDLQLFVNLHPADLHDVDLVDEAALLTRLAPRVVLEVTERASLGTSPSLTARIERLRRLGFRLAVDDIGAGYSGLTSFAELMPEIVKVDMSLVRDVHRSALKQRTIAALVRLCHDSGCRVVAEGVETVDERDCVVAIGCDLLQGYLLGRPVRELPAEGRVTASGG